MLIALSRHIFFICKSPIIYVLVLFMFCFGSNIYSKAETLNDKPKDSLLIDLREEFSEVNRQFRDDAIALIDSFETLWMNDEFTNAQKEVINNTFSSFE